MSGSKRNDQEGERTMETRTLKKARQAIDLMTNTMLREGSILSLLGPELEGPSEADLRSIFRVFDRDHDGFISGTEIGAILETIGRKPTDKKIEALLAKCDPGKTGRISIQSFVDFFEQKAEERRKAAKPPKAVKPPATTTPKKTSPKKAAATPTTTKPPASPQKASPKKTAASPPASSASSSSSAAASSSSSAASSSSWGAAAAWSSSPVPELEPLPVVVLPVVTHELSSSEGTVVAVVPSSVQDDEDDDISANNVLLKVSFSMPKEQRKVVFVCDTSGSMNGVPRQRVEAVVEEMLSSGYNFDIINYSSSAVLLQPQAGTTVLQKLRDTWASGGTNFCRAFECMNRVLQDPDNDTSTLDFIFLTDGQPTDGPLHATSNFGVTLPQLRQTIAGRLARTGKKTVIHCFGLGRSAQCDLLEKLRVSGNVPGMFSYAAPADSNATAELATLLSFATTSKSLPVFIGEDETNSYSTAFTVNEQSSQLEGELWIGGKPTKVVVQATDTLKVSISTIQEQPGDLDYELTRLRRDIYLCKKTEQVNLLDKRLKALRGQNANQQELDDLENELDQVRTIVVQQESSAPTTADLEARSKAMPFREQMSRVRRDRVMRSDS